MGPSPARRRALEDDMPGRAVSWRVQGRNTGEAWKTLHTCGTERQALAEFAARAAQAHGWPDAPRRYPQWGYVRLVLGAAVIAERSMRDWAERDGATRADDATLGDQ